MRPARSAVRKSLYLFSEALKSSSAVFREVGLGVGIAGALVQYATLIAMHAVVEALHKHVHFASDVAEMHLTKLHVKYAPRASHHMTFCIIPPECTAACVRTPYLPSLLFLLILLLLFCSSVSYSFFYRWCAFAKGNS